MQDKGFGYYTDESEQFLKLRSEWQVGSDLPAGTQLCRWAFAAIQGSNITEMIACQAKDHSQRPHLAHHFLLLAQMWVEADKHDFADLAVTTLRLPSLALSTLLGGLSFLPRLLAYGALSLPLLVPDY